MRDVTAVWPGLAEVIRRLDLRLVGIAGAPGSGKSTLARSVAASLEDSFVLSTDDYYLPKAQRGTAFRSSHDLGDLVSALDRIRSGRGPLTVQRFSGEIDDRVAPVVLERIPAHVLLEGFALGRRTDGYDAILERLDLLVFLEVDERVAKQRRFAREDELRARGGGFSEREMQRFWDEVLEPGLRQWLDDARAAADVEIEPDTGVVRTSTERVFAALGHR